MSISGSDPYKDKLVLFAQVDEIGVVLFQPGEILPNLIDIPYVMWDAILAHIATQRAEVEAELAAGKPVVQAPLRMPNFNEIDFKNFPR